MRSSGARHVLLITTAVVFQCNVIAFGQVEGFQPAVLVQAESLLQQGYVSAAEIAARQYLREHGDSADGHFLLAQILFRQTKAKESLAEYTEGAKHKKPSAFDLKVVALDYVLLFDYIDADKWLTRSVALDPRDSQAWYYLGRTKYNENRFDEAIGAFNHCLQLTPRDIKAEDNLGLSYQGLGRLDNAIAAYRTAIQWQANSEERSSQPYIDLGSLFLEQDRIEDAMAYFRQAIEISPEEPIAHEQLGKAYLRQSELVEAQAELEKAVELAPQNAPQHYVLAQVYRKRGFVEKAQAEFGRFSALNENHSAPGIYGPLK